MAKYYVQTDNGRKYIKEIDYANSKLTFTDDSDKAYRGRDGFYADATREMIARGFSEEYPEVAELKCTSSW
jgi:hypothetical protein